MDTHSVYLNILLHIIVYYRLIICLLNYLLEYIHFTCYMPFAHNLRETRIYTNTVLE